MATRTCAITLASLPPEMVLNILSYLDAEDAVSCLAVSKLWREVVGSQDFFWKKACLQFGLPEYVTEEHIQNKKCCTSLVDLFLAARRQRLYISRSSGVFLRVERVGECQSIASEFWDYDWENMKSTTCTCRKCPYQTEYQYVNDGYILEAKSEFPSDYVATVPQSEVELKRFHGSKVEKVCVVCPDVFGLEWVRVLPHHQCIVTASPRDKTGYFEEAIDWVKYAIAENEQKPPDVGSQPLSVAFPAGYAAYQNIFFRLADLYSSCSCCPLMVSASNMVARCSSPPSFISNPTWDLSFITLDSAGELACVHKETIDHHASCYYPYKADILSCPNSCSSSNICSSHTLIFQAGGNIRIYQLGSSCFALDFHPICSFELKRDNDEQLDHFAFGEITVSSDGRLLGILQHANTRPTLHVWDLTSSGCTKVGLMKINLSCPAKLNLSCPTLYALGHTYFILALQSPLDNIKYTRDSAIKIVVISTYTGDTIWEYTKQIRNVSSYTIGKNTTLMGVPQPGVECLAVIKEQWLSDIHTVSSPTEPFMVFTNFAELHYGRRTIDGLCFNP